MADHPSGIHGILPPPSGLWISSGIIGTTPHDHPRREFSRRLLKHIKTIEDIEENEPGRFDKPPH
jgi:hypothetical protein